LRLIRAIKTPAGNAGLTGAEGADGKARKMTNQISVKANQFTNRLGTPEVRDFMHRVLVFAEINPEGMKFSLTEREIVPEASGNTIKLSLETGVFSFCKSLVRMARWVELVHSGEADSLNAKQMDAVVDAHEKHYLGDVWYGLDTDEQDAWDREVESIERFKVEVQRKREAEIYSRPVRILGEIERELNKTKKYLAEQMERLSKNPSYEFSWVVESIGINAHLQRSYEMLFNNLQPANNEHMRGGPVGRLEEIERFVTAMRDEAVREIVRRKDWADGGKPGTTLDNICKSRSHAEFIEFVERLLLEISWMTGRDGKNVKRYGSY